MHTKRIQSFQLLTLLDSLISENKKLLFLTFTLPLIYRLWYSKQKSYTSLDKKQDLKSVRNASHCFHFIYNFLVIFEK